MKKDTQLYIMYVCLLFLGFVFMNTLGYVLFCLSLFIFYMISMRYDSVMDDKLKNNLNQYKKILNSKKVKSK